MRHDDVPTSPPISYIMLGLNIVFLSALYMPKKKSALPFEDALAELEQLVNRLEQGDVSLEESLRSFERGVSLTRTCQQALQEAEQKIQILLEKNGTQSLEPFTDEPSAKRIS